MKSCLVALTLSLAVVLVAACADQATVEQHVRIKTLTEKVKVLEGKLASRRAWAR